MKEALLGCAEKTGAGYNQLRTQSNLTTFIQDNSRASLKTMVEKGQLVSFPTSATYNKASYDKMQGFEGSYLVVCESMDSGDMEFKSLRPVTVEKIDLGSGRRAKIEEMEERLNRYMELMKLDVRPKDVKCDPKAFFKT